MHRLLAAANVQSPYVLLGASFGGLLANLYANTYPDEVVGMVLLDSPFPDALSLERLVKPEDRYEALNAEDENETLDRISHFKVFTRRHGEYIRTRTGDPGHLLLVYSGKRRRDRPHARSTTRGSSS